MAKELVVVGGAGVCVASAIRAAAEFRKDLERIVIADVDEVSAKKIIDELKDDRIKFVRCDGRNVNEIAKVIEGQKWFIEGFPFELEPNVYEAARKAKASYISVNSPIEIRGHYTEETWNAIDSELKEAGIGFIAGGGCDICDIMAKDAIDQLDEVNDVEIYWLCWRPLLNVGVSAGLVDTYLWEEDPVTPMRSAWEYDRVKEGYPPFGLEKVWKFPEPFGEKEVYVLTHWEVIEIPVGLKRLGLEKKMPKKVVVRGTWPEGITWMLRMLNRYGYYPEHSVEVDGVKVNPRKFMDAWTKKIGQESKISYAYQPKLPYGPQIILQVEVTGAKGGVGTRILETCLQTKHPYMEWFKEDLVRDYCSYVGVGCEVLWEEIMDGMFKNTVGYISPVEVKDPVRHMRKLEERGYEWTVEYSRLG